MSIGKIIKDRNVQYAIILAALVAVLVVFVYTLSDEQEIKSEDDKSNDVDKYDIVNNIYGISFDGYQLNNNSELRFITVGDVQGKPDKTKHVVDFINKIPSDKIDFAVFLGDYIDTETVDTIKNNMKKPYYVVEGNHDEDEFSNYWNISKAQYYKNVSGFQIVIPSIDWKSYNWSQVNTSTPTIVFNHGPVLPNCGSNDDLHRYAFDMKEELDKLNMLAFYNGHTHTFLKTIQDGRLYVAEDALTSSDRGSCTDGASDYVGYTFIKTDGTVSYTRLNYSEQFSDNFHENDKIIVKNDK